MRIRPRPVASPPGRACGVFAGPAIGLPVSDGSIQTLRGGTENADFDESGGESESQPASLQPGPDDAENRPIPPCPIRIRGAPGGPPSSARGTPSDMRIPWLMSIADPSGPSAFSAACRQSPLPVKTPVIEATLPHPAMAVRSNAGDRRYIDADASSNEVRRRADPNYSKLLYSCYLA